MPGLDGAAEFQHVQHAEQIGADVGFGILDAVTNACLRGEMDHDVGLCPFLPRRAARRNILQHRLDRRKPGHLVERSVPSALQLDIVVGCDAVEADHGVPVAKQATRDVKADEAGSSGDQEMHQATTFGAIR